MAFQKQSCSPLLVLVFSLGGALAQAPPSGIQPYEPYVPLYNGTEADLAFPGGAQHAIYTDPPAFPTGPFLFAVANNSVQTFKSDDFLQTKQL